MPTDLPVHFLEDITKKFSDHQIVGSGGYGQVYKGVLTNGTEIAVKKLYDLRGLDDVQFSNEFSNLMRVQHKNIVRFIGYCNEARHELMEVNGEDVLCKMIYKVLCFEYLPRGSLENYLHEESRGLDWCTRYKIIMGICEGLSYLHGGLEEPILHLDLKPANILLDNNMVPKIADFGVSRPFGGSHTHTTKVCVGSEYYMAPEYLAQRKISNKNDIFSLGIIIIQIMVGHKGYSKYGEMSSTQQFVDLVANNWRNRIGDTSMHAKEECQQVKKCVEIAVRCVEVDRHSRPAINDIIHELKQTEIYTRAVSSSQDQAKVAKIGLWGGAGGSSHYDIEVAPRRLESLIISSGEVIYSLEFSYIDHSGQQHTSGTWGGYGPNKGNKRTKIQLGLIEYVTEVSGTIGPFDRAPAGVITSLTFITNKGSYGPFGEVRGTPFHIPVQDNGSIVGFFARAGWYVDAFGIYVNPKQKTVEDDDDEDSLAKIGPWGWNGGSHRDIKVAPRRLESVTIHSGNVIDSLEFSYSDRDGQKHSIGPWGGLGGTAYTIELGPLEFLTGICGTMGPFNEAPDRDVVTSLTLITNARRRGPFGRGGGSPFQIPMRGNGSIVGFFGCADSFVHAIGVYANPHLQEAPAPQTGLTRIGPWGRSGGESHYVDAPEPHRLVSVTIRSGDVIDSIEFSYADHDGSEQVVGPWGGPGGNAYKGITGTFGPLDAASPDTVVITSLTFSTNQCLSYGPFGQGAGGGGTPFTAPGESDGCIVGFFARAGCYLDALGVYTRTDAQLY
ncbi:uncharacterized protein [Oryza sativa Japonica Group]|uniref:uncharacterized protein isoform X2 n=1 Tax=Oryza sativa subsp. japonica TaxID=39947 RepID=UPI0007753F01